MPNDRDTGYLHIEAEVSRGLLELIIITRKYSDYFVNA